MFPNNFSLANILTAQRHFSEMHLKTEFRNAFVYQLDVHYKRRSRKIENVLWY